MSTVADKLAKKSTRKTTGKQVRLRLVYIDFWSALKLSFLAAIAVGIATVVSFFFIHLVLQTTDLITKLDEFIGLLASDTVLSVDVLSLPNVRLVGVVVAILNRIVITVLGAVMAGVYNMAVKITGGLLVGFMSS